MGDASLPKSLNTQIWLYGNPIFSLGYVSAKGRSVYVDTLGYRPDPSETLRPEVRYEAVVTMKYNSYGDGIPYKISVVDEERGSTDAFVYRN
jgi:hypothetical protein